MFFLHLRCVFFHIFVSFFHILFFSSLALTHFFPIFLRYIPYIVNIYSSGIVIESRGKVLNKHMMLPNNRLIIIVCLSILIKSIIASSSSNYDNEKFTILTRNDFQTENYFATMKQDENVAKNGSQSSTFYDHPSSTMPIPNDSDDSKTENENSIELTTTVINLNINLMNETNNDFEISYNDVDCSEFNEQKLMNIVICSTEYINNASNNLNRSDVDDIWNSTKLLFGDEFNTTNIPNNTSTTIDEIDFDSTAYLVQVVTTSVILGIIILATVIGNTLLPSHPNSPPSQSIRKLTYVYH